MSNKPYVFMKAAYVHESHTPRFGLDHAEYDALVEGLRRLGAEQFEALADTPVQVHALMAAVVKLQRVLAEPGPAFPYYSAAQLLAECDPNIPRSAEVNEWMNAPKGPLEGKP